MKNLPKTVTSILGQKDTNLATLVRRAGALSRLDSVVNEILPSHLKGRCQVANIRNKQLIILCKSAAWATHLKHEQGRLLSGLNSYPEYTVIDSVRIKIAPPEYSEPHQHREAANPGVVARSAILELADILDDPQLRASVQRLAKTIDK